jgi:asparagine synthetase B (glutamine-hydrolysing)
MMSSSGEIRRASQHKVDALLAWLGQLNGAVVAFSAGVDSTFVLAAARRSLGDRVPALTAHSPSVPLAERESARALARRLDVRHVEVDSHEMEDPRYVANAADRCYYCKRSSTGCAGRRLAATNSRRSSTASTWTIARTIDPATAPPRSAASVLRYRTSA